MPPKAAASAAKTRGRPRKADVSTPPAAIEAGKKRGRPAKAAAAVRDAAPADEDAQEGKLQGRGRARQQAAEEEAAQAEEPKTRQKRRGRPAKEPKEAIKKVAVDSRVAKAPIKRRTKLTADQEIAASPVVRSRVRKTRTANAPPKMKSLVVDEHPARRGQSKGKGGRPAKKTPQAEPEPAIKKPRGRKPAAVVEAGLEPEEKKTRGRKPTKAAGAAAPARKTAGRKAGKAAVATQTPTKKTARWEAGKATLGKTAVTKPAERRPRAPNGMTTITVPKWAVKELNKYLKELEAAKAGEDGGHGEEDTTIMDASAAEGAVEEAEEQDENAGIVEEQPVEEEEGQHIEEDKAQTSSISGQPEDDVDMVDNAEGGAEEDINAVPAPLLTVHPINEEVDVDTAAARSPFQSPQSSLSSQSSALDEPVAPAIGPTVVTLQEVEEMEVEIEDDIETAMAEPVETEQGLQHQMEILEASMGDNHETTFDDLTAGAFEAQEVSVAFAV
ncbi:hypothetical protein P154DRAFT_39712 [Amniculicola lignicola CBS 123094]|uniref:Uncharacterized protein n=1 Tax=Amniculicola lignicola CBS 123094 TaxID=1392246 RepID=A0A6A5W4S7_9PLEO|nr:hypothetical protein P154DRAFT_39712 [Amniculicola lignicola CBS 123094]